MSRFTRRNLNNIKDIFERETGANLQPFVYFSSRRKLALLIAAVFCCLILVAFTYPLFTPLDGDELTLAASYEGEGIVRIYVENGSNKKLQFQKKTKLFSWVPDAQIPGEEEKIKFENIEFPAHSSGYMTVDLSQAYDINALEEDGRNPTSYYLLLTNNNFLFGHDWICSFNFGYEGITEINEANSYPAEGLEKMEEELRFYFATSYQDQTLAMNEANFVYLQKVDEMIKRFDGTVVTPMYPTIMVAGPSKFLDPQLRIRTDDPFVDYEWTIADPFHRLLGATALEKSLSVTANIPSAQYAGSVSAVPVIYTLVYESNTVTRDAYGFSYGRFFSFGSMDGCKVYEDEHYTIYDVTDFVYTDLEVYLDCLQEIRSDLRIDTEVRQQIRKLYKTCKTSLGERIFYQ